MAKPTKTISAMEKQSARSAAAAAGGLFLSYDEKMHLDERVNRLNRKVRDLEKKIEEMQKRLDAEGKGGVMSKVRRMSNLAGAAMKSLTTKDADTMSPEEMERYETAAAFAAQFCATSSEGDDGENAAARTEQLADKPKKGKMRRLSAAIFGNSQQPGAPPSLKL